MSASASYKYREEVEGRVIDRTFNEPIKCQKKVEILKACSRETSWLHLQWNWNSAACLVIEKVDGRELVEWPEWHATLNCVLTYLNMSWGWSTEMISIRPVFSNKKFHWFIWSRWTCVWRINESVTYRHPDKSEAPRRQQVEGPPPRWPVRRALAPTKREDLLWLLMACTRRVHLIIRGVSPCSCSVSLFISLFLSEFWSFNSQKNVWLVKCHLSARQGNATWWVAL